MATIYKPLDLRPGKRFLVEILYTFYKTHRKYRKKLPLRIDLKRYNIHFKMSYDTKKKNLSNTKLCALFSCFCIILIIILLVYWYLYLFY